MNIEAAEKKSTKRTELPLPRKTTKLKLKTSETGTPTTANEAVLHRRREAERKIKDKNTGETVEGGANLKKKIKYKQ